jgi:hypothetical protein
MKPLPKRRREDVPTWLWRLECSDYGPIPPRFPAPMREAPRSEHREAAKARSDGDHALLIQEEGGDRVLFLGDRVRRLPRKEMEAFMPMEPSRPIEPSRAAPMEPSRAAWLESVAPEAGAGPVPIAGPDRDGDTRSWDAQDEDQVAREVTSWKAERELQRRRVSMAKVLLILTERLHRCRKRDEVLDVLSEMAHQVVEASGTVVYAREAGASGAEGPDGTEGPDGAEVPWAALHPRLHPDLQLDGPVLEALPTGALASLCGPSVFTAEMLETGEEPELAGLREVFSRLRAASLLAVPLGDEGLMVVLDPPLRRTFDDEDCFFLRSIARSAEERLARVYSPLRERAGHSISIPSNASSMNSTAGPQSSVDRGSNP